MLVMMGVSFDILRYFDLSRTILWVILDRRSILVGSVELVILINISFNIWSNWSKFLISLRAKICIYTITYWLFLHQFFEIRYIWTSWRSIHALMGVAISIRIIQTSFLIFQFSIRRSSLIFAHSLHFQILLFFWRVHLLKNSFLLLTWRFEHDFIVT